ncbi:MAG: OB-fold-containig protein [Pseudomonadota bacterium]
MDVLALLLDPGMRPFSIAIGVVFGLFVLELALLALGASMIGDDGPTLDTGGTGADGAIEADFDPAELDTALDGDPAVDLSLASEAPGVAAEAAPAGGFAVALSWLGIGRVPFLIWLAGSLSAFGLSGYLVQLTASTLVGATLSAWLAAGLCLVPGLFLGARVAGLIGRIMPRYESSAISRRAYGNRRGVITVGTARRGKPAQARFTDANGNFHYVMVEPLRDDEAIQEGSTVAIVRLKGGDLRAVRLAG